jgi:hypothetical protein
MPKARTKNCPQCGEEKSLDEFHRNKARSDGRSAYCKPCHNENTSLTNQRKRLEVVEAIGGPVCVGEGCGITDIRVLLIDHKDGGGNQHRADAGSPWSVYAHALKYPDEYQVLCWNCSHLKRHELGEWSSKEYRAMVLANPREKVTHPPRWARDYDACRKHGGTDVPVKGKGLCRNCYMQERRADRLGEW